jgi:hypothetical protein
LIEVARQVFVGVVGGGPIVICVLDAHIHLSNAV